MKLYHQLNEEDQQNAVSWCVFEIAEDLLNDTAEMEAFSDEDEKIKQTLEQAIIEAKKLPAEEQEEYLIEHKEAGEHIINLAFDLAKSSWYAGNDENVIFFEDLRPEEPQEEIETETSKIIESIPNKDLN